MTNIGDSEHQQRAKDLGSPSRLHHAPRLQRSFLTLEHQVLPAASGLLLSILRVSQHPGVTTDDLLDGVQTKLERINTSLLDESEKANSSTSDVTYHSALGLGSIGFYITIEATLYVPRMHQ